jgi:hypothetical protein
MQNNPRRRLFFVGLFVGLLYAQVQPSTARFYRRIDEPSWPQQK